MYLLDYVFNIWLWDQYLYLDILQILPQTDIKQRGQLCLIKNITSVLVFAIEMSCNIEQSEKALS